MRHRKGGHGVFVVNDVLTLLIIDIYPIYPTFCLILSMYIRKHSSLGVFNPKRIRKINLASKIDPGRRQRYILGIFSRPRLIDPIQIIFDKVEITQDNIPASRSMNLR